MYRGFNSSHSPYYLYICNKSHENSLLLSPGFNISYTMYTSNCDSVVLSPHRKKYFAIIGDLRRLLCYQLVTVGTQKTGPIVANMF